MSAQSARITVGQKILILATSFALLIAVLVYFVTSTIQSYIRFADLERMGNQVQRPLESILEGVQAHQLAAFYHATPDEAGIEAQAKQVERGFEALVAADQAVGAELQFTDEGLGKRDRGHVRVANVSKEWSELANAVHAGGSPAELAERYAHVVSDLRTMIVHAGDTSNLILDPDLDSYYLMDCTLLALPQTQASGR
jgi:hypothetical protein